jgi:hypothetical protein
MSDTRDEQSADLKRRVSLLQDYGDDSPKWFARMEEKRKTRLIQWILVVIEPTKRVSQSPQSSYALKHIYEADTGAYVTNGEFKGAMIANCIEPTNDEDQNPVYRIKRVQVDNMRSVRWLRRYGLR